MRVDVKLKTSCVIRDDESACGANASINNVERIHCLVLPLNISSDIPFLAVFVVLVSMICRSVHQSCFYFNIAGNEDFRQSRGVYVLQRSFQELLSVLARHFFSDCLWNIVAGLQ